MQWRPLLAAFLGALWLTGSSASAQVVEYYHLDGLGNVRAVTDALRNVIERHDYLPFGEECTTGPCASNTGVGAQPRKFTGKERDAETGLDYFGARYYASNIGRFTIVDPVYNWNANLVDPQRWNRYAYGRNNPLRNVDPDGRDTWDVASGVANAFGTNFALGLGRQDAYNSDYALGQFVGDLASIPAGIAWAGLGGGSGGLGILGAAPTGGVSLVATAAGAAIVAQGSTGRSFWRSKRRDLPEQEARGGLD